MGRTRRRRGNPENGFTILELLVVVLIIGILAAIAIVNYTRALDLAKQRESIADIREMAMAWERYAIDHNGYTFAGAYVFPSEPVTLDEMKAALVPAYSKEMHELDGWGNPYEFSLDNESYAIRCLGKDGAADANYDDPDPRDFDTDIVFAAGNFVVYPASGN